MKDSQLPAVLTPVLAAHGLELETADVLPAGGRRLLRVVVDGDGPQGRGPGLDQIAEAASAVSAALDAADVTGAAPYTLEVSSRGVDRPLTLPRHWRRNVGRLVSVRLHHGDPVTGRVLAADQRAVRLEVGGSERELDLADVRDGRVQVEFKRPSTADAGDAGEED